MRPFGSAYTTTTDFAYHLVYPKARPGDAKIAAFRDWLLAEAQRHAERFAALPGSAASGSMSASPPKV